MPPRRRRFLLIVVDALLLSFSVWLSFWLRLAHPFSNHYLEALWLLPMALIIGLPLYAFSGQYKGLTRYVGSYALYWLAMRNAFLVLTLISFGLLLNLPMPPLRSWLLLWLLFTGSIWLLVAALTQ